MTGMEQNLRYIEREIRFMVKDQFGNPTYVKYADRVIEDACGIPNFCTTVLSSKRPLTAILRAVRGPRGDIIVRFFNVSLHDTRIEMVMVLSEVAKLRIHNNSKSRNAHEYLMKLYRKANKRMVRLITGSKNKDSFKSMYRGLRDFAKMDDFDYDEDDDEYDDYLNSTDEFGDSDYAEACLDAYRDGKTPPEIDLSDHIGGINPQLKGNEEILREIASIESKLGRHLTDAELDKLLCGDDDDESSYPIGNGINKDSDRAIDNIVDVIYEKLLEKFGKPLTGNNTSNYESLDDFIDREDSNVETKPPVVKPVEEPNRQTNPISGKPTTEVLIGMHNKLKNDILVEYADNTEADTESELDGDESNSLPPNDELGGKYNEAELIDVGEVDTDNPVSEFSEEDNDAVFDDMRELHIEDKNTLIASDDECPPHMQHALLVNDCINDCKLANDEMTASFINRLQNYFDKIGITINDIFVGLAPSNADDKLFTLLVTVRISGDYEIINMMHVNMVALMYIKNLAERFEIPENLIDTELNVVDSANTFEMDLKALNTLNKDFTPVSVNNLYSALSAISIYVYRRLNKLIDVRFVNDPNSSDIDIYLFSKTGEPLGSEFDDFCKSELIGEDIITEIKECFNINKNIDCYLIEDEEEFFDAASKVISQIIDNTPVLNRYAESTKKIIKQLINDYGIDVEEIEHRFDVSTGRKNVIVDMMYRAYTRQSLSRSQVDEIAPQYDVNGEYLVQPESILRAITLNSQISVYVEYPEYDTDDNESVDETPKTSNFGI